MSQRTTAGLASLCLLAVLCGVAGFMPLPYVTYSPGPTVDVLSTTDGAEKVVVSGHKAYRDEGELRLTTIYVDQPQEDVTLPQLLSAYFSPDEAVYPRDAVYAPDETDESSDRESEVQMASSQDSAVATALTELGYEVETYVEVLDVTEKLPADGRLEVGDRLLRVGSTEIIEPQDVVDAVDAAPVDEPLDFLVRRDGKEVEEQVTPRLVDQDKRVGITPGAGYTFPFDVRVTIGDNIGGPSAGLIMSLAVYDTLTPGSLTGGHRVAGTGTIDQAGEVGPIGGIQQKIAGARDSGTELFLVPAANCAGVAGVDPEDMRLARVATLTEALDAISAWVEDPDADLPTCEDEAA
jgi:PDZ domain-containing protein